MKELEKEFEGKGEVKGRRFVQLASNDAGYLYEVVPHDGSTSWFEVFKRKVNTYFDCISFPTSKAFGLWAWTTPSASRARELFEGLKVRGEAS